MQERETQRGLVERDPVGFADALDRSDAVENVLVVPQRNYSRRRLGGRWRVCLNCKGAPRTMQIPRCSQSAQESFEPFLLKESVAAGEQEQVESPCLGRSPQTPHSLTPAPTALITPFVPQFDERLVATVHEGCDMEIPLFNV